MTSVQDEALEAIRRCVDLRDAGKVEAVLRSEFTSRLRRIFPDTSDESWINQYSAGAEAHTKVGKVSDIVADRFIDNLVGSTTIEFEADLRVQAKFNEGLSQVREHTAGLIRFGVPPSQVRGILSDTIKWLAFDVELNAGIEPASCTENDVELTLVQELDLESANEVAADSLIAFVRKHLAREMSRPLNAELLSFDLGLNSPSRHRSAATLHPLVVAGREGDDSVALATDLWSSFVDYLEKETGDFRVDAYVDEVYLCILARLLSANVLAEQAILSDEDEVATILNGSYFAAKYQLSNMVETDYFGWLTIDDNEAKVVPVALDIQRDLYAYDFSYLPDEDVFGQLMAQLATRSQRRLLGQEWTPKWLASMLAQRCLESISEGEPPQVVDMCCGSGSILAEVLKHARSTLGLTTIAELNDVATGFDIDPLAVTLAKTTWVATLANEIKSHGKPIVVPIYHADSLFAVTPVSSSLPFPGADDEIAISLDGTKIGMPGELFSPELSEVFDRIVDWAYDEALDAKARGESPSISEEDAKTFLETAAESAPLSDELREVLCQPVCELIRRMAELSIQNRNGIWAFILRNTYRPALLAGQFNGLVSNPPWLAMSGLADNPYREMLTGRAQLYGIRPSGPSFLHLELGTVHLLHAVDRYLKAGAAIVCLEPGTILNGQHHEPFRQGNYLTADRHVPMRLDEIWQIAPGTFKYPSIAVVGLKETPNDSGSPDIRAFLADKDDGLTSVDFSVAEISKTRTAWVLEDSGLPVSSGGMSVIPQQGADLMPRAAVCVEVLDASGPEYRVTTPDSGSAFGFTMKAAKQMKGEDFPGYCSPEFIYRMAQSENLLPFVFGESCAPVAFPAIKATSGTWTIYEDASVRRMGHIETARRFSAINSRLSEIGQGKSLQDRIDERLKLSKQTFGNEGYLLLTGAGGKHICSAVISLSDFPDLVIDQTIYWLVIDDRLEAEFYAGMLNSHAMTEAITPFNPKGAFGERHIHALPYRLLPKFDPSNEIHRRIGRLSRLTSRIAHRIVAGDSYLSSPDRALTRRRSKLREALLKIKPVRAMESMCATVLGISPDLGD